MSGSSDGGRLTTHVLDTAAGTPASGLLIELFRISEDERELLVSAETNSDGRCDSALLEGDAFQPGTYELIFHLGKYFGSGSAFYDSVPVRFIVSVPDEHYHVPLLVSPYGYSTYRGS